MSRNLHFMCLSWPFNRRHLRAVGNIFSLQNEGTTLRAGGREKDSKRLYLSPRCPLPSTPAHRHHTHQ